MNSRCRGTAVKGLITCAAIFALVTTNPIRRFGKERDMAGRKQKPCEWCEQEQFIQSAYVPAGL